MMNYNTADYDTKEAQVTGLWGHNKKGEGAY